MNGQPCDCQVIGQCRLCAIWGKANGLPVQMPRQPTASELNAFLDSEGGVRKKRSSAKPKPSNQEEGGLFSGNE